MRTPVMSKMPKGGMTRHSQRSWHSLHSLVPPFLLTFVTISRRIASVWTSILHFHTFRIHSPANQIQSDPISVSGPRWKRQKQYCSAGRPFEGICQGTAQHTLCHSCVSFVSLAVLVNSCMCVAQALQESAGCLSLLISMLIPLGRR